MLGLPEMPSKGLASVSVPAVSPSPASLHGEFSGEFAAALSCSALPQGCSAAGACRLPSVFVQGPGLLSTLFGLTPP